MAVLEKKHPPFPQVSNLWLPSRTQKQSAGASLQLVPYTLA